MGAYAPCGRVMKSTTQSPGLHNCTPSLGSSAGSSARRSASVGRAEGPSEVTKNRDMASERTKPRTVLTGVGSLAQTSQGQKRWDPRVRHCVATGPSGWRRHSEQLL